MNTKNLILSTTFTLMSWQGVFAMETLGLEEVHPSVQVPSSQVQDAPKGGDAAAPVKAACSGFLEECQAILAGAAQSPLLGKMTADTMVHVLKYISFEEGWKFLNMNAAHHEDVDVWRSFARLHSIPVTKDADTAEKVRGDIISVENERKAFRIEIQSAALTPELMTRFLQTAYEKSFLWDALIDALIERLKTGYKYFSSNCQRVMNQMAYDGHGYFRDVPEFHCRTYLEAVAARRNPDGTLGLHAEYAQWCLNSSAYSGQLGFTGDRGTPTAGYDYLVKVAARRNPDGTPGLGAEYAKNLLAHTSRQN